MVLKKKVICRIKSTLKSNKKVIVSKKNGPISRMPDYWVPDYRIFSVFYSLF